jgi:hypothetical protein
VFVEETRPNGFAGTFMLDSVNKLVTITPLDESKKDFTDMDLNTISYTRNIGSLKEFC